MKIDEIDLAEYETQISLRRLRAADFEELVQLQRACFPKMKPWLRDQIESQLTHFPEGQLVIEIDGVIVASCANLIVEWQPESTERVLLCAHYDTRPLPDRDPNPQNYAVPVEAADALNSLVATPR